MSRRPDGGSNVTAAVEVARVETKAPALPVSEQDGSS